MNLQHLFPLDLFEIKRVTPIAFRLMREKILSILVNLLSEKVLVKNVFNTDYGKRVLICYLPEAFKKKKIAKKHTNLTECFEAGKIFHDLGFVVDCCNVTPPSMKLDKYDVIYGSIAGVKDSFSYHNNPIRIAYSPGAQYFFALNATAKRTIDVYKNKNLWFPTSIRYNNATCWGYYASMFADHVIILGNDFVKNEYLKYDNRIEHYSNMPAFFFPCHIPDLENKNYSRAKTNFLWFGSFGLFHKGLDICLDIAINHPEITLHICGASKRDRTFWDYYIPLIKGKSNIIDHGFVDIESQEFAKILDLCAFVVNPSISEGCCTSLLNVIGNGGLIPIYSQASGVNFCSIGMEIQEVSIDSFNDAIQKAMSMDIDQMKQRSQQAYRYVCENYTLQEYRNNLKRIIINCLK